MNALRQLAPYAAIELILPGGSLIALALWLYRRYRQRKVSCQTQCAAERERSGVRPAAGRVLSAVIGLSSIVVERHREYARGVKGLDACAIQDLLPATRPVGYDDRANRAFAHRWQERQLGHGL
jgi:hypothetical protein